jgi:uncharacterized protein YuzE
MRITYSDDSKAAYIYFYEGSTRFVKKTLCCFLPDDMINIDFDYDNRMLGVEIMDADQALPQKILEKDYLSPHIRYNNSEDTAFIYLGADFSADIVKCQICDPDAEELIYLLFNKDNIFVGLKINQASKYLSSELLNHDKF